MNKFSVTWLHGLVYINAHGQDTASGSVQTINTYLSVLQFAGKTDFGNKTNSIFLLGLGHLLASFTYYTFTYYKLVRYKCSIHT
jgi:hypothetical protein